MGRQAYARNRTVAFYPYVSDLLDIGTAKDMKVQEGAFDVEIYTGESPEDPRSTLVQTVRLNFPPMTLPIPVGQGGARADFGLRFPGPSKDNNNDPIRSTDVVRSIEYVGTDDKGAPLPLQSQAQGDLRIAATKLFVPGEAYQLRDPTRAGNPAIAVVHGLQMGHGDPMTGYSATPARGTLGPGVVHRGSKPPILPAGINGVRTLDGGWGDWERGLSKHMDGCFGGKVDEGNAYFGYTDNNEGGRVPYYRGRGVEEVGQSFFTPNRQLPSPVSFGSLPSGAFRNRPWQTLLFRPDRTTARAHPGAATPEDHLMLDLFNLPIVEPYAISEPFSSAGKINLNYIMAPFGYAKGRGSMPKSSVPNSYIRRDTGLRAVLTSAKLTAIASRTKEGGHDETPVGERDQFRWNIDLDQTIAQIEDHLQDPKRGLFRSASEICTVDLYPDGLSISNWGTFWDGQMALTADNMREQPYGHIYPRVTTKSNTFTVHMRCQTIKQAKRKPGKSHKFDPEKDQIVGEYRGSAIVERFIDPNDPDLKNYNYQTTSVDPYYRFRIVGTKQFAPQ